MFWPTLHIYNDAALFPSFEHFFPIHQPAASTHSCTNPSCALVHLHPPAASTHIKVVVLCCGVSCNTHFTQGGSLSAP